MTTKHGPPDDPIPALRPRGTGHQFVCYADSCSGVPGALHERTFAEVNRVVARLHPQPEFICFPGDEIQGLLADDDALREQWRYWIEREMSWLDHESIPLYHTTGNHTTYDAASEAIFREMLPQLPRNGAARAGGPLLLRAPGRSAARLRQHALVGARRRRACRDRVARPNACCQRRRTPQAGLRTPPSLPGQWLSRAPISATLRLTMPLSSGKYCCGMT